jgi:hypothetical protein
LRLPVVAFGEWLMVLPATVFLAAAALRLLQPRQYEPARTSWIIFDWATAHISSSLGAGMLLVVMPGLAFIVGCALLLGTWRKNEELRSDTCVLLNILKRQRVLALRVTAALLGGAILVFAVAHVVTD